MKSPDEIIDPTFTPLRNDRGGFKKVEEPSDQTKKDPTDPEWDKINPDIIRLCQRNGMARQCLELYLHGDLTWMECLETMVVALGKELVANQAIVVETRNDYASMYRRVIQIEENPAPVSLPIDEILRLTASDR